MKYIILVAILAGAYFWYTGTENADHLETESRQMTSQSARSARGLAYAQLKAACEQNAFRAMLSMNLEQCMARINAREKNCEAKVFGEMDDDITKHSTEVLTKTLEDYSFCIFELN